jgi:hypothetical protein
VSSDEAALTIAFGSGCPIVVVDVNLGSGACDIVSDIETRVPDASSRPKWPNSASGAKLGRVRWRSIEGAYWMEKYRQKENA